jgi:dTMP kinase
MFITFEGIDGAGKSTLIEGIKLTLEKKGISFILTREPGATQTGKAIRELLLHTKTDIRSTTELLLYAADRAQHVEQVIQPALKKKQWVLCDRYIDSTTAYQGYGRELDLTLIQELHKISTQGLLPDLTFFLDGNVSTLLSRAKKRSNDEKSKSDRLEAEAHSFFERVQNGFRTLAKENPNRFMVLNAEESPSMIIEKALAQLSQHLD